MINSLVGNTPLIKISEGIYAKLETFNPTGSIKDRIISYIFNKSIASGELVKGTQVVEATSGNTGISLSAICSSMGFSCNIIMPRNMSEERKNMMRFFGANVIEVDDYDFKGAINLRNEMVSQGAWSPMQFENNLNILCHYETTGPEILEQTAGDISAFVSGAGTGGTIMGVSKFLKERDSSIKSVFMRPLEKHHGIQGVGDGADYLLDMSSVDVSINVGTETAKSKMLDLSRQLGIPVGISAAANIVAAERYREEFNPTRKIVTILCDRGERYMSNL